MTEGVFGGNCLKRGIKMPSKQGYGCRGTFLSEDHQKAPQALCMEVRERVKHVKGCYSSSILLFFSLLIPAVKE